MASTTARLGLTKPAGDESLDVSVLNDNYDIIDEIFAKIYPVGAIYMTAGTENPGSLFGGTWTKIENRFLVAAGSSYTAGSIGGAEARTVSINQPTSAYTLTVADIPSHSHQFTAHGSVSGGTHKHSYSGTTQENVPGGGNPRGVAAGADVSLTANGTAAHTHAFSGNTDNATPQMTFVGTPDESTKNTGGGGAHAHTLSVNTSIQTIPPYLAVNVWQRTA